MRLLPPSFPFSRKAMVTGAGLIFPRNGYSFEKHVICCLKCTMALALSPRIRCSPSATTDPPLPNPGPLTSCVTLGKRFPSLSFRFLPC